MVIRAADTIALQRLTDSQTNLAPSSVTLATPESSHTVPVISRLQQKAAPQQGALALTPLAYVTSQTLATAMQTAQYPGVTTIPELFEVLHGAGQKIFGVVLPWGVLDCSRQLTVQYAHELMLFYQRNHKHTPASPETHKMSSDTIMTLLQVRS